VAKTRLGDLVSQGDLIGNIRETIRQNLHLWLHSTHPVIAGPIHPLALLGEVDEVAELLARHAVQAIVFTEVPAPATRVRSDLDRTEMEFAAANNLIDAPAAVIRQRIVAASMVVRPRPASRDVDWVAWTAKCAELASEAAMRSWVICATLESPTRLVCIGDEHGTETYEGTIDECLTWLREICPGCRKRAHASETDDNGYHPECLARVRGAMELGSSETGVAFDTPPELRQAEPEDEAEAADLSEMGAHHTMSSAGRMVSATTERKD
jgi:hypothetical protein